MPVTAGALDIRPDGNGGVRIERGSGGAYGITACIGAGARTQADAQAAADSIRLEVSGSRVRLREGAAAGAAHTWSAQLIVTAPDGGSIAAETSNGPIGVRDFIGTLDLRASNGPISIAGRGGEFDVQTSNGPIDIRLDGPRWDAITARASNGPVSRHSRQFPVGRVEVRSPMHSPRGRAASRRAPAAGGWDDARSALAAIPIVVRVSTVNGPVT